MIVGTVMALVQTDVKRLLAYSGVAHAGYILTALVAGWEGLPAMWFYVSTYAFMVIGAFAVIAVVSGPGSSAAPLEDLKGLAKRNGELAWLMAILILGMSGIPFFAGFAAKVYSFIAALGVDNAWPGGDNGYLWLVIIGTLTTVIGLAFYLKVISTMFTGDADDSIAAGLPVRFAVVFSAVVTVVFGIVPHYLIEWLREALLQFRF